MDYQLEDTIYLPFTTRAFATGIPTVLAGTPLIDIYEDATATPIVTSETLAVSLNGEVGFNMVTVTATAATGFNNGGSYTAIINAGTVDSVSAVGEVVGHFTIGKSAIYKTMVALDGGVVDSGTTTTIVDAALLTQVTNDHWVGAQVQMTGGTAANLGAVRTITGFTASSDTITFAPALLATVAAADTYIILSGNFGVIEVDGNNRVDVGAVGGTVQTAGDLAALITTVNTVVDALTTTVGTAGDGLTAIDLPNQTMDITGSITGNLSGSVGSVTGAVGSVAGNVDGNVTGSVGSNLELGPTEVNAQVVDVLFTDTDAEPAQGIPAATTTLADKIGFLYKAWRNRSTQTATQYSLYNDDGTTVDHKATVSDDTTTADKTEVISGP